MKYTIEQAIEQEKQSMGDAIASGEIELNDECLERFCDDELKAILKAIPEADRAFLFEGHLQSENCRVMSGYDEGNNFSIAIGEIEEQFEGKASDWFEDESEWTISGDLAYAVLGGLTWEIDCEALKQEVKDWYEI